jgi:hypothetical protein
MERQLLSTIAVTALLSVASVVAQEGADFSGTWVKDPQASESLADAPATVAKVLVRLVIEQSPDEVRITRHRFDGQADTLTYSFRPTESALPTATTDTPAAIVRRGNTETASAGAAGPKITDIPAPSGTVPTNARAEWKDGRLMLQTDLLVNGKSITTTERFSMSPNSRELIVEADLIVHHGYESAGGASADNARKTAKDVYIKAKD